jgi:hypothetical protein
MCAGEKWETIEAGLRSDGVWQVSIAAGNNIRVDFIG